MLKKSRFAANVRTINIQTGQLDIFTGEKRNFKEFKEKQEAEKTQEATTA